MQLVLRFELPDGRGIYQAYQTYDAVPVELDRHPRPENDAGLADWYNGQPRRVLELYSYGFANLAQARAWMYRTSWLERLELRGALLRVFLVPKQAAKIGFTQAVFPKGVAKQVAEYKPTALHSDEFDVEWLDLVLAHITEA